MNRDPALQEAIDAMPDRNGKLASLAEKIGVTPQAISQWERVPLKRVRDVSLASGVPIERLRPDVFARDEAAE